jgi:hypothetical protein
MPVAEILRPFHMEYKVIGLGVLIDWAGKYINVIPN